VKGGSPSIRWAVVGWAKRSVPTLFGPSRVGTLRFAHPCVPNFSSDDQLVTLYLAAPSGSPEQVLPTFKAARDVGARITIHVGVGPGGRNGLLEKLNAEKALGADTTYVHCCTLNDTEWGPQNVDTVLIAGKVMKRNGQMPGLDFARLERLGDEARDRVYAAAKVKNTRV